ncbi:SGNH/GDSL hydrolase family protein [Nocardia brasiliensis]|uniref:SGNH/GDSL hydrolase family protein n=1 Tax=Nocardia brasiliensis TaxID=37326 RepID=UPI003672D26C
MVDIAKLLQRVRIRYVAAALLMIGAILVATLVGPRNAATTEWDAVWVTAQQRPVAASAAEWAISGFTNQTVRQVVRVGGRGEKIRVRLSNVYGQVPLEVTGATIARSAGGAAVHPDTVRPLMIGLRPGFQIAPGGEAATDPVLLPVAPQESLTVTLYLARPTGPATHHAQALATSYRADGDHRADPAADAFTELSRSWYYLAGIDAAGPPRPDAVVAFGDSITDGYASTVDMNSRYPDRLAEKLAAHGLSRPVLNAGISGNRVTVDSTLLGDGAVSRFRRDVLAQPGVGTVLVLAGINDIGMSDSADPIAAPRTTVTADRLIDGYRELIRQSRAAGVRIVGATLLPFEGSPYYTAEREQTRQTVNAWIRTSGAYDAVIDFDAAMSDPGNPRMLNPAYDSGDHLHPGDAGYRAMADAIDAGVLTGS